MKNLLKRFFPNFGKKTVVEKNVTPVNLGKELYYAVRCNDVQSAIELIQKGADVNYSHRNCGGSDYEGVSWDYRHTPLDEASSPAMKKLLLHHGAKTQNELDAMAKKKYHEEQEQKKLLRDMKKTEKEINDNYLVEEYLAGSH